jgi:hypothetical protein
VLTLTLLNKVVELLKWGNFYFLDQTLKEVGKVPKNFDLK